MNLIKKHTRKDYQGFYLSLNRLNVKYFFSVKRKSLRDYIESEKSLKMYLICDGKRIGEAEFSLNDFVTNQVPTREYYQNFTGYREMIPY